MASTDNKPNDNITYKSFNGASPVIRQGKIKTVTSPNVLVVYPTRIPPLRCINCQQEDLQKYEQISETHSKCTVCGVSNTQRKAELEESIPETDIQTNASAVGRATLTEMISFKQKFESILSIPISAQFFSAEEKKSVVGRLSSQIAAKQSTVNA